MSHLHIPDGILPLWLVGLGWLVTIVWMAVGMWSLRHADRVRLVPRIGVVAALVVAAMSTEIVPIAYHLNLTVLAGVILGPGPAILVAFVVNLILALFGHGGVTVIGLNTIIVATEMTLGSVVFRLALRALKGRAGPAAGLTTVLVLFLSTTLMVGIVALSRVNPANVRDTGSLNPSTLSFGDPFREGLFANRIVTPESEAATADAQLSLARFAAAIYILGSVGWAIEALLIGYMAAFIVRVRPGLLERPLVQGAAWT